MLITGILTTPLFAVVSIDYASIGNAGNANDASSYGSVAYAYQIAKNETTLSQYAEFLNAAAKTDSYGLYSTSMTTSYTNGISQSGVSGSFTYSVNPGSGNKPITFTSWFDGARFCNWLQSGQQTGEGALGSTPSSSTCAPRAVATETPRMRTASWGSASPVSLTPTCLVLTILAGSVMFVRRKR